MEYKYDKLNVSIEEHVGKIIINDPPGNCFTLKVMKAILDILDRFEADDDVRCVMFSHEGPNFSSHGSGHEEDEYILENGYSLQEVFRIFREPGEKLVKRIDEYPKPTISVGSGACIGAAHGIFLSCDIRIVGESIRFWDHNLYWGTPSDWGVMGVRLPLWMGRNKVMDYAYLDEELNGRQLYEMGLVSKVIPDALVKEAGLTYAKKMATTAPLAVRCFKEEVRRALYPNVDELHAQEVADAEIVVTSEDTLAGITAFARGEQYYFKGK